MENIVSFREVYQCDKWNKNVRLLKECRVENIGKRVDLGRMFNKLLMDNGFGLCCECQIVWTDGTICIGCDEDN